MRVSRLRKKLESAGVAAPQIKSLHKLGYALVLSGRYRLLGSFRLDLLLLVYLRNVKTKIAKNSISSNFFRLDSGRLQCGLLVF